MNNYLTYSVFLVTNNMKTAAAQLIRCSPTFLVMVAENKKVRLSLGITFKILSTCQNKSFSFCARRNIPILIIILYNKQKRTVVLNEIFSPPSQSPC